MGTKPCGLDRPESTGRMRESWYKVKVLWSIKKDVPRSMVEPYEKECSPQGCEVS